ncbi:Clavaminate synthase-like protein [Hymenopellis radicata]|nr:Clavaminate synthase-like protein [Hymenopellis radicata]
MNDSYETYLPSLRWFSKEYYGLQYRFEWFHFDVLDEPPRALQFARLSYISRPVLIKGTGLHSSKCIDATKALWTNEYLQKKMGDRPISVSVTPNGLADAVTTAPDGKEYFVEPHVESMTMRELLNRLASDTPNASRNEAYYLQSQNGNLYSAGYFTSPASDASEFEPLRPDVPPEISWCSEAFDRHPDAVNLWIGNGRSVTSIHSDPYENIYTVVRGAKYFTLLPPSEGWSLRERLYPHAQYVRDTESGQLKIQPSPPSTPGVRWSSLRDPMASNAFPETAHPIHITVRAGESLYLPAGWWHYVQQSNETTIALNWWYDIEMQGMAWVMLSFLRGAGHLPKEISSYPEEAEDKS